ncbi:amino acid permease [Escherichia coli]
MIAGIVPDTELANSTAPFGLAFAQMFTPEVGKVIMALMVMSCCGSLLGWQFTIAQVFKSSSDEGYFPNLSSPNQSGCTGAGMLTIVIIQSGLALMTISPSLNSQFNVLVNLAVVTNIIPYILSMAALVIIQRPLNAPPSKAKVANFVAFVGATIAFMCCTHPEEATPDGSIVTFLGWTLYGLVSPRFELKNKHG